MNGQQDLQAIIDFQVELHKFINIDLFQRGLYQIRVNHHITSKLPHKIEVSFLEDRPKKKESQPIALSNIVFPPSSINGVAVSKTFSILYKNEEVLLNDVIKFKDHLIVSSAADCFEQLSNVEFYLDVELWFTETAYVPNNPDLIRMMFRRQLRMHFNVCTGLSYYLPITFDYFHLSTVTLSVHACLVTLCLPYLFKQGLSKGGQLETSTSEGLGYDYLFFGCSINDIHKEREQNETKGNCGEILKLRERIAQLQHWQLCSLLLTSIENLSRRFDEYLLLLPPLVQCKYRKEKPQFQLTNLSKLTQQCHRSCVINEAKSGGQDFIHFQNLAFARDVLKKSDKEFDSEILIGKRILSERSAGQTESNAGDDVRSETKSVQGETKSIQTEEQPLDKNDNVLSEFGSPILQPEDFIASLVMDLAYICGSLIVIWQAYIKLITHNEKINQHLSKIHHLHRCKRFSEAFFVKEKPLSQLISPHKDSQLFHELAEKLRKSKYLQNLPVCQIECASLDGDHNSMPIIFEEKFDLNEELAANNGQSKSAETGSANGNRNDKKAEEKNLRRSSSDLSTNSSLTNSSCNSATNSSTDQTNNSTEDKQPPKSKFKDKFSLRLNKLNLNRSITRRKSSISYLSKEEKQKMIVDENLSASSSNDSNNSSLTSQLTSKSLNVEANEETAVDSPRIVINSGEDQVDSVCKPSNEVGKNGESPKSLIEELNSCPAKLIGFRHYNNVKGKPEEFLFDNHASSIYSIVETISLNKFQQIAEHDANKSKHKKKKLSSSESLPDLSVKQLQKTIKRITKKNSKKFKFKKDKTAKQPQTQSRTKSADCGRTKGGLLIDTISLNFTANIDSLNKANLELDEKDEFSDLDGFIDEDDEQTTDSSSLIHFNKNDEESAEKKTDKVEDAGKADTKADGKADGKAENGKAENDKVDSKADAKTARKNSINTNKCTILEMFARNTCLVCGVENCSCIQNFELTIGSKRLATITDDLVAFIQAKEQFRQEMSLKTKGWQFYSDFSNPASRIPYFQCDNDLIRTFNSDGVHLIVCVHGLDGNCADLRLVKTYLELGLPTCNFDFLMSESNTGKTYESFEVMTDRLCDEILKHIQTNCLHPTKVSFIGHSLGNIIIRSVLRKPELEFLLPKLHCFLSLSGPHLGTIYMTNGLVNIGLWFMQKWKKSTSLLQLCLKDNVDPYKTFIYNLSKDSKLHHFKFVLLCGSSQDSYVPRHSAHIQVTTQSMQDTSLTGQAYRDMINNIIRPFLAVKKDRLSNKSESTSSEEVPSLPAQPIADGEPTAKRCSKLMRFDVWHADAGGTNSLIGRQAHIAVLDCELFIEKFMTICGLKYFA